VRGAAIYVSEIQYPHSKQ